LLPNLIPLFLASVAPVGIALVIFLLTLEDGLTKTTAYLLSQALALAIWCVLVFSLSLNMQDAHVAGTPSVHSSLRTFLGILMLVLAVRFLVVGQDADALPLKWKAVAERISPWALFFVNLLISMLQVRYIALVIVGVGLIKGAMLSEPQKWASSAILLIALLWSQLLPVVAYLAFEKQRERLLDDMQRWMTDNGRIVNACVLGVLGTYLLWAA